MPNLSLKGSSTFMLNVLLEYGCESLSPRLHFEINACTLPKGAFCLQRTEYAGYQRNLLLQGFWIQHQEALWATRRCLNYFLQKWNLENHCMRAVTGLKGIEACILLMHCVKHSSKFFLCVNGEHFKSNNTTSSFQRGILHLLCRSKRHLLPTSYVPLTPTMTPPSK